MIISDCPFKQIR